MEKMLHKVGSVGLTLMVVVFLCISMPSVSGAAAYFNDGMEGASNWTGESPWSTTTIDAHGGETAWTDSEVGTSYGNDQDVSLTMSGGVDLSSASNPQLAFWHTRQLEAGFDFGRVEISVGGSGVWTLLQSYTGVSRSWTREQLDLTDYAGESSVKIRFRLVTDKSVTGDGWVIDDVSISEAPSAVLDITATPSVIDALAIVLEWTESLESDFASYRLFRSTSAGVTTESTLVAELSPADAIAYTDSSLAPETTYYYKVFVYDVYDLAAGSKEVSATTGAVSFPYPMSDGMEGDIFAWTAESHWGLTSAHSHSGGYAWTDSPDGAYAAGTDSSVSTKIDLGAADMPVLTFWHRYSFDPNSDYGYVEVREVGATSWKRLAFFTDTLASWTQERVDLSDYAGKQAEVRFRLISDSNGIQSDGWYIDDISVNETTTAALQVPFFDDMEGSATATNWHSSSWDLIADPHSGVKAFTDSPAGNYGETTYSALIMASNLDLSGTAHPQLTFWHKYTFRDEYNERDSGRVYLSTNNGQPGTWTQVGYFYGTRSDWGYEQIDLSQWAGLPSVRIKFEIVDAVYGTNERGAGWTIDDVSVEEAPVDVVLSIATTSQNSVSLAWTANGEADFERYEIYRSWSSGVTRSSELVALITAQGTASYTDAVAMIQPKVYHYRMWVVDADGNLSMGSNEVVASYTVPSNDFPFSDDGEDGTGKWSFGSPWGLTSMSSYEGLTSTVWTDSPGANYPADADTSLATYVDLSGTVTPVLSFWHRYSLEAGKDFVLLEVSTDDGGTWASLLEITGTETAWNQERIDLSVYAGQAHLGIRFRLTSDGANQQDGWFMDGLTMAEEPIQASYPFADDVEGSIIPWFFDSPWGVTTAHSHSGMHSWTDSPSGAYGASADTSLRLVIDLGAADMPVLSFWHKYSFDPNSDYGYVEVREVGTTTWRRLAFYTDTLASWTQDRVDLSNYAGKQVEVRFRLVSDSNGVQSDGWYIDDISVGETTTAALQVPFFDDMEGAATGTNWHSSSWGLTADPHSGVKAFTDSPAGNYGETTYSALIMASNLDLSGTVHPQLTFWHKYTFRDEYNERDSGRVYLSTNNGQPGTWTQVGYFYGTRSDWGYDQIDLSQWAGLPSVRIKFEIVDAVYGTNERGEGWTIDDVSVEEAPVDVVLSIATTSQNSVSLAWTANGEADFERYEIYRSWSSGVTRSSELVASITNQGTVSYTDAVAMIQPKVYHYRVWIVDADGNLSMGSNEVVASYTVPSNDFPFTDDGEDGTGKWSFGSPWGLTSMSSYEGLTSTVWTDSPGANYPANADTSLATYVDLSGTVTPVLSFWHRYSLEASKDFVLLEVSTNDGVAWTELLRITGAETAWNQERIDLSAYAGQAHLGIRFRLTSDSANQQDGWFMDGLTIAEEPVQASFPFADDVEESIIPWFYGSPWGVTTAHARSGTHSWTDSPGGSYPPAVDTSLKLTIDLGTASMPVLTFWHRYSFDPNSDYGYVEVREVGTTSWRRLAFYTDTLASWTQDRVDLSNYAGKQVEVRFRLVSDSNGIQSDGWYLDDITVGETSLASMRYPFNDDMDTGATQGNWHSSSWALVADAHSGSYAFTDSPAGNYAETTYADLILAGSVDFTYAVHPLLSFWHKYSFRDEYNERDSGRVYISTNNGQPGTWSQIGYFYGTRSNFEKDTIDLSQWAGLPNVRIKFEIVDAVYGTNERGAGWTIDDVRIGEDPSVPSYISKKSGDFQDGLVGTELSQSLVAVVKDSDSVPRPGILVNFEVSGGGSVTPASATSDGLGQVSAVLTLGAGAGVNTVTATIDGSEESVGFTATGYQTGQAYMIIKVSGDNQVNEVELALPNPMVVEVNDILGAPVPGVDVTFSVLSGGGTLGTTDAVVTDSLGKASNTLVLGSTTGPVVVTATVSGLGHVTFTSYGVLPGGRLGDTDGDGMPDAWEAARELDPEDASDAALDGDGDGLTALEEYSYGTEPGEADSDFDGMPDGWEILYGFDPLDAADSVEDADGDGVLNRDEYTAGTIPVPELHFNLAGITSESIDVYGYVTIDGAPAEALDEVAALDPDGVICGRFTVKNPGSYGFMHVYKDDPNTAGDEGAQSGDELTFRLWDASEGVEVDAAVTVVTGTSPPSWTYDGAIANVNLESAGEQQIPLHAGWNLISFSIKTCFYEGDAPDVALFPGSIMTPVEDIGEVFASIDGLYEVVRSFDGEAHTYDPAVDPSFNDLKYVAGGYGYWIKMTDAGTLVVNGIRAAATDALTLNTSWNLVGYWHPDVRYVGSMPLDVAFPPDVDGYVQVTDMNEVLSSIDGDYGVVRSFDGEAHTYDPMLGNWNDLDYLGPGYGMWIKMKTVGLLHY